MQSVKIWTIATQTLVIIELFVLTRQDMGQERSSALATVAGMEMVLIVLYAVLGRFTTRLHTTVLSARVGSTIMTPWQRSSTPPHHVSSVHLVGTLFTTLYDALNVVQASMIMTKIQLHIARVARLAVLLSLEL
jgi:hypothetical protein